MSSARKGLIFAMFSLYYFVGYKLHFFNLRTLTKATRFELVLICSCQWQPFHSKRLQGQQCEFLQRRKTQLSEDYTWWSKNARTMYKSSLCSKKRHTEDYCLLPLCLRVTRKSHILCTHTQRLLRLCLSRKVRETSLKFH